MTDKERLEDIKSYVCVSVYKEHSHREAVDDLKIGDFQWLIELAEKAQSYKDALVHIGIYTETRKEISIYLESIYDYVQTSLSEIENKK
jgi:hypothetical protein